MVDSAAKLTILRFATMQIGDSGNVARLIRGLARSTFIGFGSGLNRKSLIYRDDAARACLAACEGSGPGCEVFNVSGPPLTMREIVASICEALRRPQPRLWLHEDLVKLTSLAANALGDPFRVSQAIRKLTRDDSYSGAKFERVWISGLYAALRRDTQRDRVVSQHREASKGIIPLPRRDTTRESGILKVRRLRNVLV